MVGGAEISVGGRVGREQVVQQGIVAPAVAADAGP